MYYDNKTSFYIKQYGPAALILVLSIVLIGSGVFIYLSNTKKPVENEVAMNQSLKNDTTENKVVVVDTKIIPDSFESLKSLEKSEYITVDSVSNGKIHVKVNEKNMALTLIGVDLNNSVADLNTIMDKDLKNNKVKIAFDTKKYDDNNIYVYLYLNDTLYNSSLIENGNSKFLENQENKSLNIELKQSQAFAKQNSLGLWVK